MVALRHLGAMAARDMFRPGGESFTRRQYVEDSDGHDIWFWYTTPGIIIKYVVFLAILFGLLAWIVGGRVHAKRRLMRGQKPLGYHAWLLSRRERALVDPAYRWPRPTYYAVYRPANQGDNNNNGAEGGDYYHMHPIPPPMYDPTRPPVYEGPPASSSGPGAAGAGAGSKGDPAAQQQGASGHGSGNRNNNNNDHDEEYAPPAGPPPAVYR